MIVVTRNESGRQFLSNGKTVEVLPLAEWLLGMPCETRGGNIPTKEKR